MTNKLLKFMLAILGIVLLLIVLYILVFMNFSGDEQAGLPDISKYIPGGANVSQKANDANNTQQAIVAKDNTTALSADNALDSSLKRTAAAFTERFGSFSNQSNFKNISNLRIFMTDDMKTWSETYVEEVKKTQTDTSQYYGITTKAIFQEILSLDEAAGTASVLVKTKRREASREMDNITDDFYQDIIIIFKKDAGAWKVNSAAWQE